MSQYQSFPDTPGASHTLDKLKALKLPDLRGRSFLDVGCNEGFFCGFAHFAGAARSVGLDRSAMFMERARRRFPGCEFLQQGWEALPEGQFDVILLASALHYADDQPALIHQLVDRLSPNGVLVLELGIVSSKRNEWALVKRGIDEREFPTMPKLKELLEPYAWKWMGRSVMQDGDPVARHVIHISRRRPVAYLLMQPPGFGKTSIASRLFAAAGVPVVSGDMTIARIAQGQQAASEGLHELVKAGYSPFEIDKIVQNIFASPHRSELVDGWAAQGGAGDFAVDAYVPADSQGFVEERLSALGYLAVRLAWDKAGPALMPASVLTEQAEQFYLSLAATRNGLDLGQQPVASVTGFVDELDLNGTRLSVRGWAIDADGALPLQFSVRILGHVEQVAARGKQTRPDVQRHLGLPHGLVGYQFVVEVPAGTRLEDLAADFEVGVAGSGLLRLAAPVARALGLPDA